MKASRSESSDRDLGFDVIVHGPAQDYLEKLKRLDSEDAKRCADALAALGADPFRSRPGVDIARWKGPEYDYRLRRGRHRFGYRLDKRAKKVHVIDAWFK